MSLTCSLGYNWHDKAKDRYINAHFLYINSHCCSFSQPISNLFSCETSNPIRSLGLYAEKSAFNSQASSQQQLAAVYSLFFPPCFYPHPPKDTKILGMLNYTAIPYRVSPGPEQGFPCVLFPNREKPVFVCLFVLFTSS